VVAPEARSVLVRSAAWENEEGRESLVREGVVSVMVVEATEGGGVGMDVVDWRRNAPLFWRRRDVLASCGLAPVLRVLVEERS
jgi:hypothetical protein